MTPDELDQLEALAKAATPGPWGSYSNPQADGFACVATYTQVDYSDSPFCGAESQAQADAAYTSAAHPGTVLALIAEVRLMRKMLQNKYE